MSASSKLITIIGGSGFLGRHITRALARQGHRIRVAVRRPDLAGHVQPLGTPGQIMPVQANVRYPASVEAACAGADVVINLVGVLYSSGAQTFSALHAEGARVAARAAKQASATQFIQMSAIGADEDSHSNYARTKGEGEKAAAEEFPGAIIIRPSVVFGPEDNFFNQFAGMARLSPVLPLIGGGATLFQPVFAGDVAEAVAKLVADGSATGETYELGGPAKKSFREILQYVLKETGRKRLLVPLPFPIARIFGAVAGLLPSPVLTADQVELLKSDNVVSDAALAEGRTLQGLGITPEPIEAIVPSYLYRYRKAGQFSAPFA
jgi:NADH dehydrogenase